ncbi:hypothetical protein GGI25_002383 [Coemansia spiralis]|uniref:Thioredoxin domain-containing protein n=2 Tax=Coemansia TaxID=4863 RepID=A0A9W8G440_9FUNG|nr:hypothetical protein BX070DRAFT_220578 [Coemansia spiralis]KAJ1991314.1 hypothetical protein EDC05_003533 [Coemansia umbellata]KAJ2622189.1 hypothetical protein GGI26_003484 [Coemansia sp. RSA 1358]KAJ2678398.1 hypothetical protein GGI25_002383 [Coemansia spiralis]
MKSFVYFLFATIAAVGSTSLSLAKETTQYSDELEAQSAAQEKRLVPKSDYVIELDRPTYFDVLSKHDEVLIEFYANWCMACHGLSPEFDSFAKTAHKQYPKVAIARADINKVEYLSSSFMVDMLPQLVYLRRPNPGITPEVRYVSANFSSSELLDYIGGGWTVDEPSGSYATLWCTPTNLCGHIGGLLGESVILLDQRFNPFDIPPWAFMAIIVSVIYLLGQFVVSIISGRMRNNYRKKISNKNKDDVAKPINFDEYRSDLPANNAEAAQPRTPTSSSSATKSPKQSGGSSKRSKGKRSNKS